MMGAEKKGVPRKGKLAALPLPSAQGPNPGYSSHTRGRLTQPRVPGIASGLTEVGLGMALA